MCFDSDLPHNRSTISSSVNDSEVTFRCNRFQGISSGKLVKERFTHYLSIPLKTYLQVGLIAHKKALLSSNSERRTNFSPLKSFSDKKNFMSCFLSSKFDVKHQGGLSASLQGNVIRNLIIQLVDC